MYSSRIINAAFEKKVVPSGDDTLVLFAELEDGQLIRLEDTGPKSYLCKRYQIATDDSGREDFRNLNGRNAAIRKNGNNYTFLNFL